MTTTIQKDYLVTRIVDKLTEYLVEDYSMELPDALSAVYHSKVYCMLQDKDASLYSQSASYVYELLKQELNL